MFSITSRICTPLYLDEAKNAKTIARVIVDVDLAQYLHEKVLVELEGLVFFVEHERLP